MKVDLFKYTSDRQDEKGRKYTDLVLAYTYNSKVYVVRVKPCFTSDYKLLLATAKELDSLTNVSKYMK